MSIIIEEHETSKPQLRKFKAKHKPPSQPTSLSSHSPPAATASTTTPSNPFQFWFYCTLIVSLVTLFFITLSYLSPQDPKTCFFNLPRTLHTHYSNGRTVKVQIAPNLPQIDLFSIQTGHNDSDSHVLIVHGIGCSSFAFRNVVASLGHKNIHVVAIDLPGSEFSDKTRVEFGSKEMGKVLSQVIDSMGLSPVDLVLHDSAFALSANWILENRASVRSLVVLDGGTSGTAFPLWTLGVPVVKELVLGSRFLFRRVVASCCMKSIDGPEADAHRILLKGRDGVKGKKLNMSFDLSEWGGRDEVKDLPVRVLWSGERAEEGRRIFANALPMATFGTHSGGSRKRMQRRWRRAFMSLFRLCRKLLEEPIHVEESVGGDHAYEKTAAIVALSLMICSILGVYYLQPTRTTEQQPSHADEAILQN